MITRRKALLVTNSHMPGALGDSIAAIPALVPYVRRLNLHGFIDSVIWSCPAAKDLFSLPVVQFNQEDAENLEIETMLKIDTQEVVKKHWSGTRSLVQMYGDYATVDLKEPFAWSQPTIAKSEYLENRVKGKYALLAPFSHSDSGTNTKNWESWKWHKLAEVLREQGIEPVVLGLRANKMEPWENKGHTLMVSQPLPEIMWAMAQAQAVITVDNGMGWLAQALQAPHVQILSSNMPAAFAWDHGPLAKNLSSCRTVSVSKVWDAVKEIQGLL